jgi:hypothetical protein
MVARDATHKKHKNCLQPKISGQLHGFNDKHRHIQPFTWNEVSPCKYLKCSMIYRAGF